MYRLIATVCCAHLASSLFGAPPASYEFKPGRSATYDIEVEFHERDRIVSWKGSGTYSVESVEGETAQFRYQGDFVGKTRPRNEGDNGAFPLRGISHHSSRIGFHVTTLGEVSGLRSSPDFPLPLGPMPALPFVTLPEATAERWATKRVTELGLVSTLVEPDEGRPGMQPHIPSGPSRTGGLSFEERLHLTETITCAAKPDAADFERIGSLISAEEVNGKPMIEFNSTGTVTFSEDRFLPARVEWTGSLILRVGDGEVSSPVSVSARRLSDDELAERAAAAERARLAAADRLREDLGQLVEDLESGDSNKARAAAMRLDTDLVAGGDAEVAAALHESYKAADDHWKGRFGRALVRWATAEQTDLLIALVDDDDVFTRRAAIERLADLHVEKSIPAIAARLRANIDRTSAAAALTKFGSAAEPSVLELLDHRDVFVRHRVIELLKTIGTGKSLGPLKKAAQDKNPLVQRSAEAAIEAIEERLQAPLT